MHEVGIMQSALDIAERQARQQGATRISRIGMRVGALSGVVPDALEFAFNALKQHTSYAALATLAVEYVPLQLRCLICERDFVTEEFCYSCPACGATDTEIHGGRELDVAWVELETDTESRENANREREEVAT